MSSLSSPIPRRQPSVRLFPLRPRLRARVLMGAVACVLALSAPACSDDPAEQASEAALLPIADHTVLVGASLRIPIAVDNPDGLALTYAFEAPALPGLDDVTSIGGTSAGGEFVWSPLASHVGTHDIVFVLQFAGGEVRETVRVTVEPGSRSAPVFLAPGAGGTFDLSRSPCVAFDVEVRDDDSPDVLFESTDLPAGATLSSTGAKSAEFSWCPTGEQVAASLRWEIAFSADDGDHAPSEHIFVVILRAEVKESCTGTPPIVTIVSPAKGDVVSTSTGYEVLVNIEDDVGVRDAPVLSWSTEVADENNPDLSQFATVFCQPNGTTWRCLIPPLDLEFQEQQVLYVVVSATDNDDTTGTACDHHADSELLRFVAEGGAAASVDTCGVCTASSQCASGVCVSTATGGVCLVPCAGIGAGCERGACVDSATTEGATAQVCGPRSDACSTGPIITCEEDAFEFNDNTDDATPIEAGTFAGNICEFDLDYFAIDVEAGTEVVALLDGFISEDGDLDLSIRDDSDQELATSAGTENSEFLVWCAAESGTLMLRVEGYLEAQNPYELSVLTDAAACCPDDEGEPDSRLNPRIINPGDPVEGTICPGNDDFFAFDVTAPSTIGILLVSDTGLTDLDIELLNEAGVVVDESATLSDEVIEYEAQEPGIYTLRIFGFEDDGGDYVGEVAVEVL